jgi:hypothetical protein
MADHPDERSGIDNACRVATDFRETGSMVSRPDGDQFHFDPATYLERIRAEVPAYDEPLDAVAEQPPVSTPSGCSSWASGPGRRPVGCSRSTWRQSWSAIIVAARASRLNNSE